MTLVLICLLLGSVFEFLLWVPFLWRLRSALAIMAAASLSASICYLLMVQFNLLTVLLLVTALYREVNLFRIIYGRTRADYLRRVARRSSLSLIVLSLLLILLDRYVLSQLQLMHVGYLLAMVQFGLILVLVASLARSLKTSQPVPVTKHFSDRDLPTVTVAIPARNETDDLVECLHSLVGSKYPKLEILVLDDCSQNARTPELIRGFAHDGVRFIAGKLPPEGWLAKNFAYQQLAAEANGELILFCGVDTRFMPDTIGQLVNQLMLRDKSMLCVLPKNLVPQARKLAPLLVQPSRYAWELSLPRRWLNRPPILATCWLVRRKTLEQAGTFKAIAHGILPERYFADYASRHDDGYAFVISDDKIGLTSHKSFEEQRATAVRTRYPQLHRRPDLTGLLTAIELFTLLGPFVALIVALLSQDVPALVLSIGNVGLLIALYAVLVRTTYRRFLWRSLFLMPAAAIYDICLLQYSMLKYEFGEVIWKGRNVCVPVMRVIPRLPKI